MKTVTTSISTFEEQIRMDRCYVDKTSYLSYDLIASLASRHGQVVVLVDEYDKMVTDHINSPHVEDLRRVMENFYQVIKGNKALIRFAFLTGVTRLTLAGIFGGLNNLNNISMDEDYATMFGHTQQELEKNFSDSIELGMQNAGPNRQAYLEKIRENTTLRSCCRSCPTSLVRTWCNSRCTPTKGVRTWWWGWRM